MGAGQKLQNTVKEWGILIMFVVIISIVLLKFKDITGVRCSEGYTFNATGSNCYLTTNASVTANVGALSGTIDTFVTAFSEPKNWIGIVVIVVIAVSLFGLFYKLKTK